MERDNVGKMHDTHCHIDLYKTPTDVATSTERSSIFTIAVTNLPSAYYSARPHMRQFRHLKLAVGMHPLLAEHHTAREKQLFRQAFQETQYIGEIGLDFSKEGIATKDTQIATFRFVLELLRQQPKVVTLHSRRAESTVVELLIEYRVKPVIFHWYSGSMAVLDQALAVGHYFSINTAMIQSRSGQKIVNRIPIDKLLIETDGPFIEVLQRPVMPTDIGIIHNYLAHQKIMEIQQIISQLQRNLNTYMKSVGQEVLPEND